MPHEKLNPLPQLAPGVMLLTPITRDLLHQTPRRA
jgi:hypothetical protein